MAQLLLTFHHASDAAAARVMASSRTLARVRAPALRSTLEALSMSGWPLPRNSPGYLAYSAHHVLDRIAYCHAHRCAAPRLEWLAGSRCSAFQRSAVLQSMQLPFTECTCLV